MTKELSKAQVKKINSLLKQQLIPVLPKEPELPKGWKLLKASKYSLKIRVNPNFVNGFESTVGFIEQSNRYDIAFKKIKILGPSEFIVSERWGCSSVGRRSVMLTTNAAIAYLPDA